MFYRFASNVRSNLLERCDLARVKFLPFYRAQATFSLHVRKASVGIVCLVSTCLVSVRLVSTRVGGVCVGGVRVGGARAGWHRI